MSPHKVTRRASGLKLVAASALVLGFCLSASAMAQTTPQNDETVIVTGQRKAAQSAQAIKKKSDLVVDSIVAEDIGKLPDNNVAEALARVTGVQIRRDSGEGNSVLIRGLPNVVTLLNGREVFTTTGRFIALADVPANMLQRVDVYKSSNAEQIEGGIAGTIDIRTRRPFDQKGSLVTGYGNVFYNDKAKSTNFDIGTTLSNRWNTSNGEVGALLALSHIENNFHEERAFNVESVDQTGFFAACPTCVPPVPNRLPAGTTSIIAPFVMGYIPISGQRDRTSLNFALQWRPSDATELYAEGFATEYKNLFSLDFFVGLPLLGDGNISATVYPGTNILKTLTNHNVFTITSTQANDQKSFTTQFAVGGSHRVGNFKYSTDLSITDSTFEYKNPIVDAGVVVPLVKVDTSANGTAQLDYGGTGFDIKKDAGFSLANFFDNYGKDKGSSVDWRADVLYTPETEGFFRELSAGVRFASRKAEHNQSFVGGTGGPATTILASSIPGFGGLSEPMASGGPDYVMTQWYTPSRDFLLEHTDQVRRAFTGVSTARPIDPGAYFSDDEKTASIYGQAKVGGDLGLVPWSAVVGVRVVKTEEALKGNLSQETDATHPGLEYTPIDRDTKNTDILPSINSKFTLRPDLIARFTAGRTITRPNFADMNPGVSLSTVVSNTTGLTGNGGNPNLRPFTSDNYDLALEWYFKADAYLTATAFTHRFDGYVQGYFGQETFGANAYRVSRPANTGEGHITGYEIGYQQFYDFLPGPFSGLGLQANVTAMEGQTTAYSSIQSKFIDRPISGLSDLTYNLILLYEKGPWSGRLAYNWRDSFQDTREFTPTYDLWVDETKQLDAQLSYKVSDKLTFAFYGINLLDTHFKDYFVNPLQPQLTGYFPRDTRRYDRTFVLSARWKL